MPRKQSAPGEEGGAPERKRMCDWRRLEACGADPGGGGSGPRGAPGRALGPAARFPHAVSFRKIGPRAQKTAPGPAGHSRLFLSEEVSFLGNSALCRSPLALIGLGVSLATPPAETRFGITVRFSAGPAARARTRRSGRLQRGGGAAGGKAVTPACGEGADAVAEPSRILGQSWPGRQARGRIAPLPTLLRTGSASGPCPESRGSPQWGRGKSS